MKKKISAVAMVVLMLVMGSGIINVSANSARAPILESKTRSEKRYVKNVVEWKHTAYFSPSSYTKCNTTQQVDVLSANFGCIVAKSKSQSDDGFTAYGRVFVNHFQSIYKDYSTLEY